MSDATMQDVPTASPEHSPTMAPHRADEPLPQSSQSFDAAMERLPPPLVAPPTPESLPLRQRISSSFSRSHLRSRSSASVLTPPAMTRAHSMPVVDGAGRVLLSTSAVRPSSPLTGGKRYRLPPRSSTDESIPSLTRYPLALEDAVPEDAELDMTPKARDRSLPPSSPLLPLHPGNTFPRRHRPSSPFRPVFLAPTSAARPSTPTSTSASPAVPLARFTETYPVNYSYQLSFSSNSSLPSTPTSARSRSPSISSLETIPDSPDAEEAALEAERIVQLKEAAEAAERGEAATTLDERRRSSFDPSGAGPSASGRSLLPGVLVSSYASRDKKKRWSVCGAERTGDLDLETIWED